MTIRIPEKVLTATKRWAKDQGIATRSEALVRLVELALAGEPPKEEQPNGSAKP